MERSRRAIHLPPDDRGGSDRDGQAFGAEQLTTAVLRALGEDASARLHETILPYWLDVGPDRRYGGFHTCFDNFGLHRVATTKFTWSQGRFVWMLAHASRLARRGLIATPVDDLLTSARFGAQFLLRHAIRTDGTCHYALTESGHPIPGPSGETRSVFADCFVAMGLSELAAATGDPTWLAQSHAILLRATEDITAGHAPTPPYPIPEGATAFGPRMILTNAWLDHCEATSALDRTRNDDLTRLRDARAEMLAFRRPDGTFREMRTREGNDEASLIARHRVPGHALEGLWVAIRSAWTLGIDPLASDMAESVDALCRSARDPNFGGLFRYVDANGPTKPTGAHAGTPYEDMVRATWDTKLWWVHTEAVYAAALTASLTDDSRCARWAEDVWGYATRTFPSPDGREWIQIRDRRGDPIDVMVALPVKDPFHIARNLMQLIELSDLVRVVPAAGPAHRSAGGDW